MKYFEKEFDKFRIIYLHNPYDCRNCSHRMKYKDDVSWTPPAPKNPQSNCFKPINHSSLETQKMSKNQKCAYPLPVVCAPEKFQKTLKKKNLKYIHSDDLKPSPLCSKRKCGQDKTFPKPANKISAEKRSKCNSPKKQSNFDKVYGGKIPTKGTLKRKRWYYQALKQKQEDENYQDDLYESLNFGEFTTLFEDDSDNAENYDDLKTPVFPFSLSPRETSPSPVFTDCYSPTQLNISRKGAEEYNYRRMKRKKSRPQQKKEVASVVEEKTSTEDALKRLEAVVSILNAHKRLNERTSDAEEDQYFSDSQSNAAEINFLT